MSSLPDVSLGGDAPEEATDVIAAEVPGVHVSDDAPTVEVTPVPVRKSPESDLERGDLNGEGDLPDGDLEGDRITAAERGLVVARHWVTQAADGARQVTSTPGGVLAARPPSFAEYRAYVRSRAWTPPGYERGWLIWLPVFYYNTIGTAGVLAGLAAVWVTSRMLHFFLTVAVAALVTALWVFFS